MSKTLSSAATVILVRDNNNSLEVLLLQRNTNASFLPEYWVFPGGAVDYDDLPEGDELDRARIAACREAHEEAGVTIDDRKLTSFSHWTAPVNFPKRYATWFFIAQLESNASIEIDNQEIQDFQWITPAAAIELHYQGKLPIMPPTFKSLFEIQSANNSRELIHHCRAQPSYKYFPKVIEHEDTHVILYNNDSGYDDADPSKKEKLDRISFINNIIQYQKS